MTIPINSTSMPPWRAAGFEPLVPATLARALGATDTAEYEALAQDLQTALARAGYHWRSSLARRATRNRRLRRKSTFPAEELRQPGRPRGAQNFATRQLALELAMIWFDRTGRPPTRYESSARSRKPSFTEFVEAIVDRVPSMLRKSGTSRMPDVEYMVRTSVADFRAARSAPEEYRRRGLIDEKLWLGPLGDNL